MPTCGHIQLVSMFLLLFVKCRNWQYFQGVVLKSGTILCIKQQDFFVYLCCLKPFFFAVLAVCAVLPLLSHADEGEHKESTKQ